MPDNKCEEVMKRIADVVDLWRDGALADRAAVLRIMAEVAQAEADDVMGRALQNLGSRGWVLSGSDGVGDVSTMEDVQLIGLWYALKLIAPGSVEWDVKAAREAVKAEMLNRGLPL